MREETTRVRDLLQEADSIRKLNKTRAEDTEVYLKKLVKRIWRKGRVEQRLFQISSTSWNIQQLTSDIRSKVDKAEATTWRPKAFGYAGGTVEERVSCILRLKIRHKGLIQPGLVKVSKTDRYC